MLSPNFGFFTFSSNTEDVLGAIISKERMFFVIFCYYVV